MSELKRILGEFGGSEKGPVLISLAGVHGNELAGIFALQRVFEQLHFYKPPFKGSFIGIAGNLPAIKQGKRYISIDLNRQWFADKVNQIESSAKYLLSISEDIQQKNLLTLFRYIIRKHGTENISLLDLHTTSGKGSAFCISNFHEKAKKLAHSLHIPVIIGLEKVIVGTTMNYFTNLGLPAFGFEAGQHNDWHSVLRTEAAIWLTLVNVGCINKDDVPLFEFYNHVLSNLSKVGSAFMELKYRHAITPQHEFKMMPGYVNFQPIQKGELIANDVNGLIKSPVSGMILMPLYQKQGDDGFFIVKKM